MSDANPLGIQMVCAECGAHQGQACANTGVARAPNEEYLAQDDCEAFSGPIAVIPLAEIPEDVIEKLREEHLQANTVDATAEDLGGEPPEKFDAQEQIDAEVEDALAHPITADDSPGEALG